MVLETAQPNTLRGCQSITAQFDYARALATQPLPQGTRVAIICNAGGPGIMATDALEKHGLEWRWPDVDLAHPLDDGNAAVMVRSIDETARGLGEDGGAWRRLFGSPSAHFDALNEDLLRPMLKEWLDEHLPAVVERVVEKEISRISRGVEE